MRSIDLFQLPSQVSEESLTGHSAVAVDVLRASTTITAALASGASRVVPCQTIEEARNQAARLDRALLGGERGGLRIDGFDLANGPEAYRPEIVRDRPVVFTTTNGTLAIRACRNASEVLIGSFSNLTAVCRQLERHPRSIAIVCAGTDGQPTMEDILLGGAICRKLGESPRDSGLRLNPAALAASEMWRTAEQQMATGKSLGEILCGTQGGINLVRLGLQSDIEYASQIDRFDFVPLLDPVCGSLRADVDLDPGHG